MSTLGHQNVNLERLFYVTAGDLPPMRKVRKELRKRIEKLSKDAQKQAWFLKSIKPNIYSDFLPSLTSTIGLSEVGITPSASSRSVKLGWDLFHAEYQGSTLNPPKFWTLSLINALLRVDAYPSFNANASILYTRTINFIQISINVWQILDLPASYSFLRWYTCIKKPTTLSTGA